MISYQKSQPLIIIHIPKTAGKSTEKIFKAWFGNNFFNHYFNEATGEMPKKYDIYRRHSIENPLVLYGHFNRLRKFGVNDYYPKARQFITILRDPFEMAISSYFYTRKAGKKWKDKSRISKNTLSEYLTSIKPNMLNHFPREVTQFNYKDIIEEYFIEIGITEHLDESLRRISRKLDMPYDSSLLGHHNATERDQEVSADIKNIFMENNPLEFEVYNYALQKFTQKAIP